VISLDARDQMAAEFVLGALGESDRAEALRLEQSDPAFARAVADWERRLAPVAPLAERIAPPADLFAAIERRIDQEYAELPGTMTFRRGARQWLRLADGVEFSVLWENHAAGRRSMLLRMQPGAIYDGHAHAEDEECLVLEGDLIFGDLHLQAGDFHLAQKGRPHPASTSRAGCLLFVNAAL
jgi:hypothetical protein